MTHGGAARWRIAAAALAAVALLGACGDDGDDTADSSTTTDTTEATTTSASTTITTTTLVPACPPAAVPEEAQEVTDQPGDVDGDGADDHLRTFRVGDEWHLGVELARGGGADLVLASYGGGIGIIGGADVDGDGADEVWAQTGAGASATIVGLARFADCSLVRVSFASGTPAEMAIGGSVGTAGGLECTTAPDGPPGLSTYTLTFRDDTTYDLLTVRYHLDGTTLVEDGNETGTVAAASPDLLRYASFTCGDLVR